MKNMNHAYNQNANYNKREAASGTVKASSMPNQNGQDGSSNKEASKSKVKLKFYTP